MAHLSLLCLGPFQAALDGNPVVGFESSKVRALLVYLAMEADRPHPREVLAGLLWPSRSDQDARSNLRYALSNLRHAVGDHLSSRPLLSVTRDTLQFNLSSAHWIDAAAFSELLDYRAAQSTSESVDRLERAAALYRGCFLEGFSLGSAPFEEWVLLKREQLNRKMLSGLRSLSGAYHELGELELSQRAIQRLLELEPWDEEAHQQLMLELALAGRRSAALAQYEVCRRILGIELGAEPGQTTRMLYESIRDGKPIDNQGRLAMPDVAPSPRALVAPRMPRYGKNEVTGAGQPGLFTMRGRPLVAREPELMKLDRVLKMALEGHGRVAFVTGEVGSGKSALLDEFARRAMEAHPEMVVASSTCTACMGVGDPCLPFREIMEMFAGEIEAKRESGAISPEHARRLWALLPTFAGLLAEQGPDLLDRFVSGGMLLQRVMSFYPPYATWVMRLQERIASTQREARAGMALETRALSEQPALFEQVARVLVALSRQRPLLLIVDDLQWADIDTLSLFFHLGKRLAGKRAYAETPGSTGSRLLLVGAYRPDQGPLGQYGGDCPLESIVHELQRDTGDVVVNLDEAAHRQFVDALLDVEPNCLGAAFRETVYRHTGGNPLLTIELLRGMQEQADITRDGCGSWVAQETLNWERLPVRVEAIMAERFRALPERYQEVLVAACVEGEVFTAEAVARVLGVDEQRMIDCLGGTLSQQYRLVIPQSVERHGKRRLSRYRFRHVLLRTYLYQHLGPVRRAYMHEAMGNALEVLCREAEPEAMAFAASQLAWHFERAGLVLEAVDYLQQAGNLAARSSAYQEAIVYYTRALELLDSLPEVRHAAMGATRHDRESMLQNALGVSRCAIKRAAVG
jgi:DNA-binding SARP family transcriptional activator